VLNPPRFLFIDLDKRCNLKCQHCMYWLQDDDDKDGYISVERRLEIIEEFAEMNPQGTVVGCGGEKMLELDNYFATTRHCRDLQVGCFSVINGTRVKDIKTVDRMITERPSEITVSLNSQLPEVHDRTRGVPGSFKMAVQALRLMLEARERMEVIKPIYAMAVIWEQNYRELDAFYGFVLNDIGAKFGPHDDQFDDVFFEQNIIRDHGGLVAVIKACDEKYQLNINPAWLEHV